MISNFAINNQSQTLRQVLQISLALHHCYCCCYFTAHASQKSKRAFVRCLRNAIGYQVFFKSALINQTGFALLERQAQFPCTHPSQTASACLLGSFHTIPLTPPLHDDLCFPASRFPPSRCFHFPSS